MSMIIFNCYKFDESCTLTGIAIRSQEPTHLPRKSRSRHRKKRKNNTKLK